MAIDFPLTYIKQSTTNTCGAASTAMMMGCSSDMEIVRELQQSYPSSVWDDGASELGLGQVARQYSLTQIYPVCQGADGWEQWLASNGPMLIQVPGKMYHSIVVAGIRGGDNGEVCEPVEVHVYEPWSGERWMDFDEFNTSYEIAGDWSNNVDRRCSEVA